MSSSALSETQMSYVSTLITLLTGTDGSYTWFDIATKDWSRQEQVDFYIHNLNNLVYFKHRLLNDLISSNLDRDYLDADSADYEDQLAAIEAYQTDDTVNDEVREYVYTKISKLIADSIIEVLHIDGEVTL